MRFDELIFPKKCFGCKKVGLYICNDCLKKVGLPKSVCPYCTKPALDGVTHEKCLGKLGLDGLVALSAYEGVVRNAIGGLKFKYANSVAQELLTQTLQRAPDWLFQNVSLIIPVPMHPKRERERGFNQAEVLAELLSAETDLPFLKDAVVKRKNTPSQTTLSGKKRRKNLIGAFGWNKKYKLEKDLSALIIDDVYTTGSTMKEVAKVLKRNGFGKAWGLAIAR